MLKSLGLYKDTEHQTLSTSIVAKTLISMPPVTQELFKDTLITLKSCLSMPVSVATCGRSFSALRCLKTYLRAIDDDTEETYSLCSPSCPQWQSRQFGFFSVYEKLRVEKWGKNKSLWQSQPSTLPLWTSRRSEQLSLFWSCKILLKTD